MYDQEIHRATQFEYISLLDLVTSIPRVGITLLVDKSRRRSEVTA